MTNIDTSHRFGIVALEDIRSNETLVEIPRNIALTSSQSSIASRLESFKERQIDRFIFRNSSTFLFLNMKVILPI